MDEILHRYNPWWSGGYEYPGIERSKPLAALAGQLANKDVVLLTGLRRVGKTTLIHQLIHRLLETVEATKIFYLSADNLALKDYSLLELVEGYRRLWGLKHDEFVYLFFDEIHFKADYEIQLKNLYDMGRTKIFASGSASLDIAMRSPALTGRQRLLRLPPLSFAEYLRFTEQEPKPADSHLYPALAEEYMRVGGLPEYVLTKDPNHLQALIDTLLYRDIAGRHDVRNRESLKDLLMLAAQSVGSPLSQRKISRVLGLPLASVNKLVGYFEEANLIHLVERQGKVNERKASPAKIFLADTGLAAMLTERLNLGALVENAIFLALTQKATPWAAHQPLRYHRRAGQEVDFVRGDQAWEVKYKDRLEESDKANLRSLDGYTSRTLVTKSQEGQEEGLTHVPAWKLLLEVEG